MSDITPHKWAEAAIERMLEVVATDPRSMRQISVDAGLGVNFLQQMLRDQKSPTLDNFGVILDQFDQPTAIYILTGQRIR